MTDKELGAVIAAIRQAAGLSQQELAERIHLHQQTICKLEKGNRSLKAVELPALCEALGVGCEDILNPANGEAFARKAVESRIKCLRSEIELLEKAL